MMRSARSGMFLPGNFPHLHNNAVIERNLLKNGCRIGDSGKNDVQRVRRDANIKTGMYRFLG
jgi:hypothetical protein